MHLLLVWGSHVPLSWDWMGAVNLRSYCSDAEGPGDCGSGVFIPEEADGIGENGSGINISFDAGTPLVAFMENLQTLRLFLSCRSIRIFGDRH